MNLLVNVEPLASVYNELVDILIYDTLSYDMNEYLKAALVKLLDAPDHVGIQHLTFMANVILFNVLEDS